MPTTSTAEHGISSNVGQIADRAASRAEQAIDSTKRVANEALDTLHDGVNKARHNVPDALTRAATQVEDLTRRGIDRAREVGTGVRDQVGRATDRTVGYIQDEPVKAVLIAAAAGAVLTVLVQALSHRRH